jgi:hypothetical protein
MQRRKNEGKWRNRGYNVHKVEKLKILKKDQGVEI